MAVANKLVIAMNTSEGRKNFSYNYSKASPTASNVQALVDALIANGSIFNAVPLSVVMAKVVLTTENVIDLN